MSHGLGLSLDRTYTALQDELTLLRPTIQTIGKFRLPDDKRILNFFSASVDEFLRIKIHIIGRFVFDLFPKLLEFGAFKYGLI